MRFARVDVREPYCLTQDRPRTLVAALQSAAAAERSNNQHSRDFRSSSIFDFCNSIGTKRTYRVRSVMSAFRGILLQKSLCVVGVKFSDP
jgi:hypothetical protein